MNILKCPRPVTFGYVGTLDQIHGQTTLLIIDSGLDTKGWSTSIWAGWLNGICSFSSGLDTEGWSTAVSSIWHHLRFNRRMAMTSVTTLVTTARWIDTALDRNLWQFALTLVMKFSCNVCKCYCFVYIHECLLRCVILKGECYICTATKYKCW